MKITIDYESSWQNSFLEGSNNEVLPKNGRKFIGSMTSLRKAENYIQRKITLNTVMGILNRLIGDQRKLYQARNEQPYFFKDLETQISFNDIESKKVESNEITYIRNITSSTDQNSYTGMIKVSDEMFSADYSDEFWGVLALDLTELYDFILEDKIVEKRIEKNPLTIIARLEELHKMKPIENIDMANSAFLKLNNKFEKYKGVNNKELLLIISLYCSGLYLQLERLEKRYVMSSAKTKAGGISGISNNGFTKKDFMNRFTTGEKKKIWGNPYIRKERIKGIGEVTSLLTKASGQLEIEIFTDRTKGKEIKKMIENAGVSSFYMGKKGLAYVSKIRI